MHGVGGGLREVRFAPLLNAEFASVAALDHALVHTMRPFGLFLQGHDGIGVGEDVSVRVAVDGLEAVVLHGMVVWRRVSSGRGNPPGIGIQFEPDAAHQLSALRRAAVGEIEESRGEVRRPVRIGVVFLIEADHSLRSGVLADLSDSGARLHAFCPPPAGSVVILRARTGGRTPAIAARLVWRSQHEAGLSIIAEGVESRAAWRRLVARRRALARGASG